jgi:hypothetical protein
VAPNNNSDEERLLYGFVSPKATGTPESDANKEAVVLCHVTNDAQNTTNRSETKRNHHHRHLFERV